MGALDVMKVVGYRWQNLTEEEKHYFKSKADKDKVRYLKEQEAFYDECARISTSGPGSKHDQKNS